MSNLHQAAGEYLSIRRALGFKLRGHDRLLNDFVEFLEDTGVSTITAGLGAYEILIDKMLSMRRLRW
jgi:hypothetical protein